MKKWAPPTKEEEAQLRKKALESQEAREKLRARGSSDTTRNNTRKIISIKEGQPELQPATSTTTTTTHVCECGHECDSQDSLWRHIRNAALLGRNQCLPITTHGRPELQQQARTALTAHYTKKGLSGDELTQTVDKVMAVQFKPRPEYPSVSLEEMQKEIADLKRENEDWLRKMEPLNQSIN